VLQRITFVGMDAHKVAIELAALLAGAAKPVEWSVVNEKAAVRWMARKVQRLAEGGELCFCSEARPCGYTLQRRIQEPGARCVVVAPSFIPQLCERKAALQGNGRFVLCVRNGTYKTSLGLIPVYLWSSQASVGHWG
jgi:hypothetical protein